MSAEHFRMSCEEFAEILHDLDRAGTHASALREGALAHAESCGRCARLLTESESLDFGLRGLAAELLAERPPARIESALLREFRREHHVTVRRLAWQFAMAMAAAVLLFAGARFVRHYSVAPANNTRPTVDRSTGPVLAESAPAPSAANTASTDEYADDFVALPYADDPATLDGGAIVRVILPQSALASFGVQIADANGAEQVPADILVSRDGTPEAIRLVAQSGVNQ